MNAFSKSTRLMKPLAVTLLMTGIAYQGISPGKCFGGWWPEIKIGGTIGRAAESLKKKASVNNVKKSVSVNNVKQGASTAGKIVSLNNVKTIKSQLPGVTMKSGDLLRFRGGTPKGVVNQMTKNVSMDNLKKIKSPFAGVTRKVGGTSFSGGSPKGALNQMTKNVSMDNVRKIKSPFAGVTLKSGGTAFSGVSPKNARPDTKKESVWAT